MDKLKWIWLQNRCGAGSTEVLTLMLRLGSINQIYNADFDTYISIGISERTAERLCDKALDEAYSVAEWCASHQVSILTPDSDMYPMSLRALPNPPAALYCMGRLKDLNAAVCIAVVGTRNMSEYGMRIAYKISYELAASRIVTVSGMALGIDGVSACASIAAGGRTIAVLGCGSDVVYPKTHTTLEKYILESGAVISEYPPSTPPLSYNFPMRNRIISGLSVGTLVVDANESSGSLITARNAIIQGKDLYAVPANIGGMNASGTNALIRDGATAVLCGRDIVKNYACLYEGLIDVGGLDRAEAHSEFDESVLRRMGVGLRVPDSERGSKGRVVSFGKNYSVGAQSKGAENSSSGKTSVSQDKAAGTAGGSAVGKKQSGAQGGAQSKAQSDGSRDDARVKNSPAVTSAGGAGKSADGAKVSSAAGDSSRANLESLNVIQKKIFDEIPLDTPILADSLTSLGYKMSEVLAALTILEIKGLVSSLPGALYIRK